MVRLRCLSISQRIHQHPLIRLNTGHYVMLIQFQRIIIGGNENLSVAADQSALTILCYDRFVVFEIIDRSIAHR